MQSLHNGECLVRPAHPLIKNQTNTMAFDVTSHSLVPHHTKLTSSDKEKLLQEHGLASKRLQRITRTDPAIIHLKPQAGDVIKVERKSPTAGTAYYYRVVIDG